MAKRIPRGNVGSIKGRAALLDHLTSAFRDDPEFLKILDAMVVQAFRRVEAGIGFDTGVLFKALTQVTGAETNRRKIKRVGRRTVVQVDHPGVKYNAAKVLPVVDLSTPVRQALQLWRKRIRVRTPVGRGGTRTRRLGRR